MSTASVKVLSYSDYNTSLLDDAVPLNGASHAEVSHYTVDIPMRYAECFAILTNGRKVPLANKRQFLGWSGRNQKHSLLFQSNGSQIEARIDPDDQVGCQAPGHISMVNQQPLDEAKDSGHRQFIAIDGGLLSIPAL